jgi:hypothetical protein
MSAIGLVLRRVLDNDCLAAVTRLLADCGFDFGFSASFESKLNFIIDRKADPAVRGHPGYRGKSHIGDAAHRVQNRRHRLDALNGADIVLKIAAHPAKSTDSLIKIGTAYAGCARLKLMEVADRRENPFWRIGLRQELAVPWHFFLPRSTFSGSDDDLNRGPAVLYGRSQPEPIH